MELDPRERRARSHAEDGGGDLTAGVGAQRLEPGETREAVDRDECAEVLRGGAVVPEDDGVGLHETRADGTLAPRGADFGLLDDRAARPAGARRGGVAAVLPAEHGDAAADRGLGHGEQADAGIGIERRAHLIGQVAADRAQQQRGAEASAGPPCGLERPIGIRAVGALAARLADRSAAAPRSPDEQLGEVAAAVPGCGGQVGEHLALANARGSAVLAPPPRDHLGGCGARDPVAPVRAGAHGTMPSVQTPRRLESARAAAVAGTVGGAALATLSMLAMLICALLRARAAPAPRCFHGAFLPLPPTGRRVRADGSHAVRNRVRIAPGSCWPRGRARNAPACVPARPRVRGPL